MASLKDSIIGNRLIMLIAMLLLTSMLMTTAFAAEQIKIHAYGPGGPAPAMQEAATSFEKATNIKVEVVSGPTDKWIAKAKKNADIIYSGSEHMMTDYVFALDGQLRHADVIPVYMRPMALLVRPGNPKQITGLADAITKQARFLVVNGAGQTGAWEDIVGRNGDLAALRAFRERIAVHARNSGEAKDIWQQQTELDAWLIWNIWQISNPSLADSVPLEPEYTLYRDMGLALTTRGKDKPGAVKFIDYIQSPRGEAIFTKWGWSK